MSIENQKEILRQKRLAKGLTRKELGSRYALLEDGKLPLGRTRVTTALPIIQALEITQEELELIYSK